VENGGALVVMGDRCQKDYQHLVRKQKQASGARLNLNSLMHVALA
jgi:alkylated DNA repair dioxygenase AlkB